MSCPVCGRRRLGHYPGCAAATPSPNSAPQQSVAVEATGPDPDLGMAGAGPATTERFVRQAQNPEITGYRHTIRADELVAGDTLVTARGDLRGVDDVWHQYGAVFIRHGTHHDYLDPRQMVQVNRFGPQ